MKLRTITLWTLVIIALAVVLFVASAAYRAHNEKSALQKLVDTTKPDISSENGLYGHYRIYTGMLICKDCDSIAARLILKSERDFSKDGVATFETTKIYTGGKPIKLPIQKALWTVMRGNSIDPNAKYISLFNDKNGVAAFLIDESSNGAQWKIIVEASPEGEPRSTSENRIGKLVLISEGNTIAQ